MKLLLLGAVLLLVACGGASVENPDPEETIAMKSEPEDVLVDATDKPVLAEGGAGETDELELVDPLLDDLEDGDERVRDVDGRAGGRWRFQATTWTSNGYVDLLTGESPVAAYDQGYAAHLPVIELQGEEALAWIGVSVSHSGKGYEPAAAFEGVQFSACGTGAFWVSVDTIYRRAVAIELGELVEFRVLIEFTDSWSRYEVPWTALNATPGHEDAFDAAQFTGLQWTLVNVEEGGELWLDDVAFFDGGDAGIEGAPCPI